MIFAWLTARGLLGLSKGLWLLLAVLLAIGAVAWLHAHETADDAANVAIGRTIEREEALTETLERTEAGNAAREETRRVVDAGAGSELYALCLRTARTPANCDRYLLPERPED